MQGHIQQLALDHALIEIVAILVPLVVLQHAQNVQLVPTITKIIHIEMNDQLELIQLQDKKLEQIVQLELIQSQIDLVVVQHDNLAMLALQDQHHVQCDQLEHILMVIMRTVFNVMLTLTQQMKQQHEHHAVQVQQVELVLQNDILFEEMV